MKLLMVLLCKGTCARCSPFQKAGGSAPSFTLFRHPWLAVQADWS